MKILIIRYKDPFIKDMMLYTEAHIEQIKKIEPESEVNIIDAKEEEIKKFLPDTDVLIYSSYDHKNLVNLDEAKKLKWVHVTSAGATDISKLLKDKPIILTNSSGVHPINIAEHVFTFMLMLARHFNLSQRNQIEKKAWVQDDLSVNLQELYQSTIGIIGLGNIGQRVAHLAKGFGMNVISLKRSEKSSSNPNVDEYFSEDQIDTLLSKSDFVVNCLPFTDETLNFFTIDKFKKMKPTAYFINIGRGKTVVENDLIKALKENIIAGAGLDVYENEPLPKESELWNLKNVIITPHYSGWTPRYIDRVINIFCENLFAYKSNKPMPTLVDKNKGY